MHRFDEAYYERLTEKVAAVELCTSAEIVVVVEPVSGHYRDVHLICASVLAYIGLLGILFGPWHQTEWTVAIDVVIFFLIGWGTSWWLPGLTRLLTSPKRRRKQVEAAANAAFVRDKVGTTRARTGLLIYVSWLEQTTIVRTDTGVMVAVVAQDWGHAVDKIRHMFRQPDPGKALLEGLDMLCLVLGRCLPSSEDNPNELPDRPRRQP